MRSYTTDLKANNCKPSNVQSMFSQCSVNDQSMISLWSVDDQSKFRRSSVDDQSMISWCSVNDQLTISPCSIDDQSMLMISWSSADLQFMLTVSQVCGLNFVFLSLIIKQTQTHRFTVSLSSAHLRWLFNLCCIMAERWYRSPASRSSVRTFIVIVYCAHTTCSWRKLFNQTDLTSSHVSKRSTESR